ncbi:MAG: ATP-binding protein [Dehalococcoidia bacterium]
MTLPDDAIVGKSLDGVITSWNPGAEQLYGYSAEEAVGRPISLIVPSDRSEEMPAILGNIARGQGLHNFESRRLRKDGQVLDVSLTISPVRDSRGRITGASTIGRDISERKRTEEALAEKTLELERSNAELEDFTHVVSHDLKEPLRGIEAFSGFLSEDYADGLDQRGQGYLTVLQDSAVRMRDLIDDLLQLSRIGRVKPQYATVSAASLVSEVADAMQFSLKEKGVDLRILEHLPTLFCDPVRIRQVLENLISNAIKYNDKPHPIVEIACSVEPDAYTFSVRDNGPGIDSRYHEKIFRIFQRLVLRDEHEGTGVGLTICKKIVEGCGGKIWVESDGPGHGSTFLFSLPKLTQPSERAKENRSGQRPEGGTHPSSGGQSARRGDHEEGAGQGPAEEPAHSGARRSGGA